ncbi:hypothetical protein DQE84_17995, partial [Staphylococcus warneri]
FYHVYDGELRRLADDDDLHPAHAEGGVCIFAVCIALAIIAIILYFAFYAQPFFDCCVLNLLTALSELISSPFLK